MNQPAIGMNFEVPSHNNALERDSCKPEKERVCQIKLYREKWCIDRGKDEDHEWFVPSTPWNFLQKRKGRKLPIIEAGWGNILSCVAGIFLSTHVFASHSFAAEIFLATHFRCMDIDRNYSVSLLKEATLADNDMGSILERVGGYFPVCLPQ